MEQLTTELDLSHNERNEEEQIVHEWRIGQLERIGVSRMKAAMFAEFIDWHDIAALVARGCSPDLAVEIVR
jgi:hypothetical protein